MTLELERVALEKVPLIEMSSRGGQATGKGCKNRLASKGGSLLVLMGSAKRKK